MRPEVNPRLPLHVVLRASPVIGSLRKRFMYSALREATIAVALRELHDEHDGAFRIVHISIQRTHVHLIVEAENKHALARGMQGFQISAAKHLNREVSRGREERRRGSVFPDRYHYEVIKNPTQARRTLAYVLKNASHCTISGRRVEFPTNCARTTLLRTAERSAGYRRPGFEDFVWDWSSMTLAGQIDLQIRYGPGVPEQLHS